MKLSTALMLGTALVCLLLIAQSEGQDCSKCQTHGLAKCDASGQACTCTLPIGPTSQPVNCSRLIPKCWLMKRESLATKAGRKRPANALIDNDGLYNPDCENDGTFKARQCNNTDTCWCVNSAGVRRTDKGDKNWKCAELVRTYWVIVEVKRNSSVNTDNLANTDIDAALRNMITTRYNLPASNIKEIEFEGPFIWINLQQNGTKNDVDITDVGYYMEKDIKGDPILPLDQKFDVNVKGSSFPLQEPVILYIDEKPHEISMKRLTAGVIAVIVVVIVAIVAGIVVLVLTRRKRGRYEKAEMKEMNEMQQELRS
ncbi:epithelial cell adhesion molecule [Hyperolius riggenbachi]|uniref:epithelial cell adhesion molecule n=1 Tax=Hyperolius riggenbachi TaxID=752182 RepID=UPI0035A33E56